MSRSGAGKGLKPKLGTQAKALFWVNAARQRRAWKSSLAIISTPFFFCALLLILQRVISNSLDTPDNKCGCYCQRCCSDGVCRDNSAADPCETWEECQSYDESRCGLQYSSGRQAVFCQVPSPSSWPAIMQVPSEGNRAQPLAPNAALLYTGQDRGAAEGMTSLMFPTPDPSPEQYAAALSWAAKGNESGAVYASAVSLMGLTLGTFRRREFLTYLLEPAFVERGSWYNASMSLLTPASRDPDPRNITGQLNQFLADLAPQGGALGEFSFSNASAEMVWKGSVDEVNRQLYCGYPQVRCEDIQSGPGQIVNAWDFQDTSASGKFNLLLWYNATGRYGNSGNAPPQILRISQALNKAANAFFQWALGSNNWTATLVGLMDFPRGGSELSIDFSLLLGPLFVCWVCQLLLPAMLVTLVYEKEKRLRAMMRMHGLGSAAYWLIQYLWFLALNFIFTWVLIGFGAAIGLSFFSKTDFSLQLVFYFLWSNCLVAFAFLLSTLFRSSRTAVVVATLYVFGTGLVAYLLLQRFITRNHWWLVFLELVPGFGLYRGLYEIAQYAFVAAYKDTVGLTWSKLTDPGNGTIAVMVIFAAEWAVFMLLAWYLEQVLDTGIGVPRHPLFFLRGKSSRRGGFSSAESPPVPPKHLQQQCSAAGRGGSNSGGSRGEEFRGEGGSQEVEVTVEPEDVRQERLRVEELVRQQGEGAGAWCPQFRRASGESASASSSGGGGGSGSEGNGGSSSGGSGSSPYSKKGAEARAGAEAGAGAGAGAGCSLLISDLRKVYPPHGGSKAKAAVQGLSLAVERGECFGLLGPNGAGKSTLLNMLSGFLQPSGGSAWVEGLSVRSQMEEIHSLMGTCPQDNLLWEALTAREHLRFYGRLKHLEGAALEDAVCASLRSVNLLNGGVGDRPVSTYSGGMKRRLSVAIALIGDPLFVLLDECSTGLDPASRHSLWDAVKQAKRGRGIILTTHSMEEAAVLCDRLGIFVDGRLVCIGNPKQLTARYVGFYVFTITTPPEQEAAADAFVRELAPGARLTYALAGTRKYELPGEEVTLAGVFAAMEGAGRRLTVQDWAITNATLEEVFIKFASKEGAELP